MRGDGLFSYEKDWTVLMFIKMREMGHFVLNPTSPFSEKFFLTQFCNPVSSSPATQWIKVLSRSSVSLAMLKSLYGSGQTVEFFFF